ncbi:MAG: DUF4040 domain-containing protein [Lachnospiraceae bacterium]|nr:DUF4040 domain-containing protein [Lachnospiraceae bacterium]
MIYIQYILVIFLVICALSVCITNNLLVSLIIFTAYSLVMSVIWLFIESPDLAITEAAVGAGITSILFFITLVKVDKMNEGEAKNE